MAVYSPVTPGLQAPRVPSRRRRAIHVGATGGAVGLRKKIERFLKVFEVGAVPHETPSQRAWGRNDPAQAFEHPLSGSESPQG